MLPLATVRELDSELRDAGVMHGTAKRPVVDNEKSLQIPSAGLSAGFFVPALAADAPVMHAGPATK
jgi:hypothetical protein